MGIPARSAAMLVFTLSVSACSSSGEQTLAPVTTAPTTTVAEVETEPLPSTGIVTIGDVQYELSFECFLDETGNALALGVGRDPVTDQSTEAVVQVFADQPYVGLIIDDEQLLELAIDAPAELFVQSGVISGSALRFVETADTAGVGDAAGLGTVAIECSSFAPGLPEGFEVP